MSAKNATWSLLALLILLNYFLAGCRVRQTAVPDVSATPTSTPEPTDTLAPTVTVVEVTPVATMSPQESEAYVEELLETNGGCSLPCVWGISPGQTKYEDAQRFFQSLGWKGSEAHGSYWTGKDMQSFPVSIRIGVYPEGDVVRKIRFSLAGNGFQEKVKYYSFDSMIRALGKPSEILAFVGTSPGILEPEQTSFEVLLHYAERNTLLEYQGTAVRDGDSYRICPSYPNAESTEVDPLSGNISISVAEAEQPSVPEELVRPLSMLPDYYLSVEKALGISNDQFYDAVSENNGNVCFESPLSAWQR
jgi:hypothetical protein